MQDPQHQQPLHIQSFIYDTEKTEDLSILIVGVGGIGCELLKVLCKMKLKSIHIIDMDTIELSNLNRQFLFKTKHKGHSKSLVAREAIKEINPFLNIHAHHMNIKELPIEFYQQFNFLVMALDNIEARNYVNKIGIRLGISVLDAGTLAYKGNVKMIIPGSTRCYSCEPKASSQKQFPVCTIRMRPEKPIHCIVWAKMLFEVFFSGQEVNNDMKDLAVLARQGQQTHIILELLHKQILTIKQAKTDSDNLLSKDYVTKINPIPTEDITATNPYPNLQEFDEFDRANLANFENVGIAKKSFAALIAQLNKDGSIIFEKDDDNIIHFIASMANLRMKCFSIQQQSFNEVKNMAGNIVPAIASTNSIVSGLEVVQMFKLYFGYTQKIKFYYVQNQSQKVRALRVERPLPQCHVCSDKALPVLMWVNFKTETFQKVVTFLNGHLNEVVEEFSINFGSNELYNSEEPNKIIMKKTINEAVQGVIELDLVILDEQHSEKIFNLWLVHTQNAEKTQQKPLNTEKIKENLLFNKNSRAQKAEKIRKQQEQARNVKKNDKNDVVYMDNQDSDELMILEVEKQPVVQKEQPDIADKVEKRVNENGDI